MRKFDPHKWVESRKAAMINAARIKQMRDGFDASGMKVAKDGVAVSDETLSQSWDWAISRNDNLDHAATSVYVTGDTHDTSRISIEPRLLTFDTSDMGSKALSRDKAAVISTGDRKVNAEIDPVPISVKHPRVYNKNSARKAPCAATFDHSPDELHLSDRTAQLLADAKAVQNASAKASPGDLVTRQMLDKNTLRLSARDTFIRALKLWREGFGPRGPLSEIRSSRQSVDVLTFVRKRPIFQKEISEKQEYDSVTADTKSNTLTVHNCLFHADLRRPLIAHNQFTCFDGIFGEASENQDVYCDSSARDMVHFACNGGLAALFMFGQTGSGKTFSMTAIERFAANDIFEFCGSGCTITVSFIEICGKKAFDLLSDKADNPEVKMRELPDGSMQAVGAAEFDVSDSDSLNAFMHLGHTRRATKATGANFESSRSHAICSVRVKSGSNVGKLMLIDCAGSERRKDSLNHDKDRRREGAEINSSLHALKECMRWRAETASNRKVTSAVPFRGSLLTRVISEAFTKPSTMLAVIATISPCVTDVEHTLSTLRTVHFLSNKPENSVSIYKQTELFPKEDKPLKLHPGKWNSDMAFEWVSNISAGKANLVKGTTGQMLVRMTEARFCQICSGDEVLGKSLFKALHDLIRDPQSCSVPEACLQVNPASRRPITSSQPSTASSRKSAILKTATT